MKISKLYRHGAKWRDVNQDSKRDENIIIYPIQLIMWHSQSHMISLYSLKISDLNLVKLWRYFQTCSKMTPNKRKCPFHYQRTGRKLNAPKRAQPDTPEFSLKELET